MTDHTDPLPNLNEITIIVKLTDKERKKLNRKIRDALGSDFSRCYQISYVRKLANDTPDELKSIFEWLFKTRK